MTPDANGNWSWSFTDLPKYEVGKVGKEIKYTISEEKITDYTAEVNGYDITNTYTPDETFVIVTKEWVEANGYTGIRPTSITVQLYEDKLFDKPYGNPVVLSDANEWTYKWEHLPVRKFFTDVNYTVKEVSDVTGYTETRKEDTKNNVVITNTLETVKVEGSKKWVGDTAEDRPESITINLFADDTKIDSKIVSPDEKGNWKWSFTDLPKYKKIGNEIKEITYTITEDEVAGYETSVNGYNVTNTKEAPTPTPTPDETPTPEETPDVTPGTTPDTTPTPEATPGNTPAPTPNETPDNTPAPTPEETPGSTPEVTPDNTPGRNDEPTPTPDPRRVLGAKRENVSASEGAVLGARRGFECAVLGRRRRPSTGDSLAMIIWIIVNAGALGGIFTSSIMLNYNRRSRRHR